MWKHPTWLKASLLERRVDPRALEVLEILDALYQITLDRYFSVKREELENMLAVFLDPIVGIWGYVSKDLDKQLNQEAGKSFSDALWKTINAAKSEEFIAYIKPWLPKFIGLGPVMDDFISKFVLELYAEEKLGIYEKQAIADLIRQFIYHFHLLSNVPIDQKTNLLLRYIESENTKIQLRIKHEIETIIYKIETTDVYGRAKKANYYYWPFCYSALRMLEEKLSPKYIETNNLFYEYFDRDPTKNEELIKWNGSIRELAFLFVSLYDDEKFRILGINQFICQRFLIKNNTITIESLGPAVSQVKAQTPSQLSADLKKIRRIALLVKEADQLNKI